MRGMVPVGYPEKFFRIDNLEGFNPTMEIYLYGKAKTIIEGIN